MRKLTLAAITVALLAFPALAMARYLLDKQDKHVYIQQVLGHGFPRKCEPGINVFIATANNAWSMFGDSSRRVPRYCYNRIGDGVAFEHKVGAEWRYVTSMPAFPCRFVAGAYRQDSDGIRRIPREIAHDLLCG